MEVHKMAEADNSSVQQKFDAIRDYIGRKETTIILCEHDDSRKIKLTLNKQRMESSMFLTEMPDGGIQEKTKFHRNGLAVCSYNAFDEVDLPLADSYIFYGLPSNVEAFPRMLHGIEKSAHKENKIVFIDIVVSILEKIQIKVVSFELYNRKCTVPTWVAELVITYCAPIEEQQQRIEEIRRTRASVPVAISDAANGSAEMVPSNTTGSSGSPMSTAPVPAAKKEKVQYESIRQIRPNAQGRYFVPARMINMDIEMSNDEYSPDESENDENEYDYENAARYDDGYDEGHEYCQ